MDNSTDNILLPASNRGLLFGDAVFETMKIVDGKILFFEDHYFRLMATMRIVRMEIPMNFTMEFLEKIILDHAAECKTAAVRLRMTVYRDASGFYLPQSNEIGYFLQCFPLEENVYQIRKQKYTVELFKDFYLSRDLLSTLKTNNRMINVTASIFAKENDFQNCFLLNDLKNVVEAINGNIFLVLGNEIITPPLSEGCLNGIMRKQVIAQLNKSDIFSITERPISPFELQKADELFVTNVISGIIPISDYRKKEYSNAISEQLVSELNSILAKA